jgi:hypothetical protein
MTGQGSRSARPRRPDAMNRALVVAERRTRSVRRRRGAGRRLTGHCGGVVEHVAMASRRQRRTGRRSFTRWSIPSAPGASKTVLFAVPRSVLLSKRDSVQISLRRGAVERIHVGLQVDAREPDELPGPDAGRRNHSTSQLFYPTRRQAGGCAELAAISPGESRDYAGT